jgi:kynurenine formamidase
MDEKSEWRVAFDAELTFGNGGGLQAQGFRLDLPAEFIEGGDVADKVVAELFVRHLGLLMVDDVRISNKELVREAHRGSRDVVSLRPEGRRLVELSHVIRDGMVTYPGLPGPEIGDHLTREASRELYAPGTEFHIGRITMVANTGTYLDVPAHRYDGAADLAAVELARLADLDGLVVRITGSARREIDRAILAPYDVAGRAVLIHTGWDRHWGTEAYGAGHPFVTADAAAWLVEQGAALVGIDSVNIDETSGGERPAHTALLAAGIPIVEHLTGLDQLPPDGFRFHAAPPRVAGMGTFPVRAYAVV